MVKVSKTLWFLAELQILIVFLNKYRILTFKDLFDAEFLQSWL